MTQRRYMGKPVIRDESLRARANIALRTDFPHAGLEQKSSGVLAYARTRKSSYGEELTHCMRCNTIMTDRVGQEFDPVKDKWRLKLSSEDIVGENFECPSCARGVGGQPTKVFRSILKPLSTLEEDGKFFEPSKSNGARRVLKVSSRSSRSTRRKRRKR